MKHYAISDFHGRGNKINIDITSTQSEWNPLLDLDTLKPAYVSTIDDITN